MTVEQLDEVEQLELPFGFPFPPYAIQREFMQQLYETIEQGKIGIFESPTGTVLNTTAGSSDQQEKQKVAEADEMEDAALQEKQTMSELDQEPDWVVQHAKRLAQRKRERERKEELELEQAMEERVKKLRAPNKPIAEQDFDPFLVEPYHQEDEELTYEDATQDPKSRMEHFKRQYLQQRRADENKAAPKDTLKILFCSRTHSQLTQFVHELQKTRYGKSTLGVAKKSVSLGSRAQMCIHDKVSKWRNVARINDACLDMQKDKKSCSCPYYKDEQGLEPLRDQILARVQDIEEIVALGRREHICPYYAARLAVPNVELVTMPYSMLLSPTTRRSLGISLRNNIVLIDEAHNVIDAISQLNNCIVTLADIQRSREHLARYLARYQKRMLGKNLVYVKQIGYILKQMEAQFHPGPKCRLVEDEKMLDLSELVAALDIQHLNLFKITQYLQESRLSHKLCGFMEHEAATKDEALLPGGEMEKGEFVAKHTSSLAPVQQFLELLTNADTDGRVVFHREVGVEDPKTSYYKFMLLNPSNYFQDVLEESRSVIFAGGTMEPIHDFIAQLLPNIAPERIHRFTCGHVIPKDNLQTIVLDRGPTNKIPLEFTFESRHREQLLDELGMTLVNFSQVVPDGMVVFFVSYAYMEAVLKRWKETGIWDRLQKRKQLFREPKQAADVEAMLEQYAGAIHEDKGALLFSVVGGKMSEGINFSDRLGRAVVMVGLPFPNLHSVEIVEKMKFVDQQGSGLTGQEYYESLCMRAVNQSIGRAIRHRQDYACVLLLDRRYGTPRIRSKLPQWMQASVKQSSFGEAMQSVAGFFKQKQTKSGS